MKARCVAELAKKRGLRPASRDRHVPWTTRLIFPVKRPFEKNLSPVGPLGTERADSRLDWRNEPTNHTWHKRVETRVQVLAGTRFRRTLLSVRLPLPLHIPPRRTTSDRPTRPPHARIRMFTSSILQPAGALAGAPAARPARSVKVNAACARGPLSVSGAHSAARCVSARFAPSDARLPVTALRAGQAPRRARRDVSARAEGSSGAQYGEVRPSPRGSKSENAPRENQQHAKKTTEKTEKLATRARAPAALTRASLRPFFEHPRSDSRTSTACSCRTSRSAR